MSNCFDAVSRMKEESACVCLSVCVLCLVLVSVIPGDNSGLLHFFAWTKTDFRSYPTIVIEL